MRLKPMQILPNRIVPIGRLALRVKLQKSVNSHYLGRYFKGFQ